jgi:predicted Ser/Thr protein kinase
MLSNIFGRTYQFKLLSGCLLIPTHAGPKSAIAPHSSLQSDLVAAPGMEDTSNTQQHTNEQSRILISAQSNNSPAVEIESSVDNKVVNVQPVESIASEELVTGEICDPNVTESYNQIDLDPVHRLGSGAFGVTYLVKHKQNGQLYALKMICVNTLDSSLKDFLQNSSMFEANIMEDLQHPSIVRLFATFKSEQYNSILMEYFDGVTLTELKKQLRKLSASLVRYIAIQLIDVLQYLRSRGVIHGDLKLDNIMINDRGQIKLIDFGSARHLTNEASLTAESIPNEKKGTLDYCPPEFLESGKIEKSHFTSDYWSFVALPDTGLHHLLSPRRFASFQREPSAAHDQGDHRGTHLSHRASLIPRRYPTRWRKTSSNSC